VDRGEHDPTREDDGSREHAQRHTKSVLERNFMAAAQLDEAHHHFVDWSHPPARGNLDIHSGTSARTQNGARDCRVDSIPRSVPAIPLCGR